MEIEEAFTTYLMTQPNLTALISTRFYPEEIPQNSPLPAIHYIKISDIKNHTLTGQLKTEQPMFQFTVYANTKATARAVAKQIKAALVDYVGVMGGLVIQHIKLENEICTLEKSADGTIKTYTEDLEFEISFERS